MSHFKCLIIISMHAHHHPMRHLFFTKRGRGENGKERNREEEREVERQNQEVRKEKLSRERGENNEKRTSNQQRGVMA